MSKKNENANVNSQLLSADDILAIPPLVKVEVPELPRNGKPGIVFVKRPSAGDMISFQSEFRKKKETAAQASVEGVEGGENGEVIEGDNTVKGGDEMSGMIVLLVVSEDGTPIFTSDQIVKIKSVRYDVWQRLASVINSVIKTSDDVNPETGETTNPFEEPVAAN